MWYYGSYEREKTLFVAFQGWQCHYHARQSCNRPAGPIDKRWNRVQRSTPFDKVLYFPSKWQKRLFFLRVVGQLELELLRTVGRDKVVHEHLSHWRIKVKLPGLFSCVKNEGRNPRKKANGRLVKQPDGTTAANNQEKKRKVAHTTYRIRKSPGVEMFFFSLQKDKIILKKKRWRTVWPMHNLIELLSLYSSTYFARVFESLRITGANWMAVDIFIDRVVDSFALGVVHYGNADVLQSGRNLTF